MNIDHLSGGNGERSPQEREFDRRAKIARCMNKRRFLRECLEEQVLPKSAPEQLQDSVKPFTKTARKYLEEACECLSNRISELVDTGENVNLSHHMCDRLRVLEETHREKLDRKLTALCNNSKWNTIGRVDLINNLSSKQLTDLEKSALSLGLKFDIGRDRKSYVEHVTRNYRWYDSDVENGFTQGVLACCKALSDSESRTIPKRFERALWDLGKDENIIITTADKGGGIIIMDRVDYDRKMMELLNDESTYKKQRDGFARQEADKFNKEARKILRTSEKGKKLLRLIEEDPQPPRMKGLPKVHKPGIPMRPITSGIGSAPHRLGKQLAKPLSKKLGTISNTHIRNSGDLLGRLRNVNFRDKTLASFDVKALFTNVPIDDAIKAVKKVIDSMLEEDLPLPKSDYLKLISLCANFSPFVYKEQEYQQHCGLPMGSPLSPVMSCLFMEMLEDEKFLRIMGRNSTWVRYVDDVLVIVPKKTNIENKLRQLNSVHSKIQFTVETEENECIPFLDIMIRRTVQGPRFSVYRKTTNKNDFIHSLSAHSDRVKSGVIIGFFLRAIRICSPEYIQEEFEYVTKCFQELGYSKGMILELKKKAIRIMQRREVDNVMEGPGSRSESKYIIIPQSSAGEVIKRFLRNSKVQVVGSSGVKIGEVTRGKTGKRISDLSVVYSIPCKGCEKKYFGESSRGLIKRLIEHKADVRLHRLSNALVQHIEESNHLPNWDNASVVHCGISKTIRKSLEAMHIIMEESTNGRAGFVNWARTAAEVANRDWSYRKRRSQQGRIQIDPT